MKTTNCAKQTCQEAFRLFRSASDNVRNVIHVPPYEVSRTPIRNRWSSMTIRNSISKGNVIGNIEMSLAVKHDFFESK